MQCKFDSRDTSPDFQPTVAGGSEFGVGGPEAKLAIERGQPRPLGGYIQVGTVSSSSEA